MTLPNPDSYRAELRRDISRRLMELRVVLVALAKAYAWAHNLAFRARIESSGEAKVATSPGDRTGDIVAANEGIRGTMRAARRSVRDGFKKIDEGIGAFKGALEQLQSVFHEKERTGRPHRGPQTITKHELARLQEAAERREARGEGYGES